MSIINLTSCFEDCELAELNNKLPELSFEFGTKLDEVLFKILGADVSLQTPAFDPGTNLFTFTMSDGSTLPPVDLTALNSIITQTITSGNQIAEHVANGVTTPIFETVTCLVAPTVDATDPQNPIISFGFEKEDGTIQTETFTFNIPSPVSALNTVDLSFDPANPLTLLLEATYTNDQGILSTITDATPVDLSGLVSSFTQTITSGNQIGEHVANGVTTPIFETITSLVNNGDNNWTYTNEDGVPEVIEVLCEGPCPWEPLSLAGGTLSDGVTTYTFTPDPAAATNDNGDGSISWGVTPLQTTMTLSFSGPVDFHLSPATFANSAIWHVSGGRTSAARTLDGSDWCYIVGAVDAQIDVQGGNAIATYVGPPNINAQEDWGTLTSLNVQNLEFDANINDTYRFQARPANAQCEQPICDVIEVLNTNVRKLIETPSPSASLFPEFLCEEVNISLPANTPITLTPSQITNICNWNVIEQVTLEEVVVKVIRNTASTLILEANSAVDITVFVSGTV